MQVGRCQKPECGNLPSVATPGRLGLKDAALRRTLDLIGNGIGKQAESSKDEGMREGAA